jgi:hypothetical protein
MEERGGKKVPGFKEIDVGGRLCRFIAQTRLIQARQRFIPC